MKKDQKDRTKMGKKLFNTERKRTHEKKIYIGQKKKNPRTRKKKVFRQKQCTQ